MSRKLYLECNSGISGDMTVAALLDLGADEVVLNRALNSLSVDGFKLNISRVSKAGIDACDFDVILDKEIDNHDHDMEYLHGYEHSHGGEHVHNHNNGHKHESVHHEHRGLVEVMAIIKSADITGGALKIAKDVFMILAEAEAKAHGTDIEHVHFHEVGAVDSIVDVIAAAVCLDNLGIDEVIIPHLCEGTGTIRCQHGILSVPVPAVTNIVADNGLNLQITEVKGELVTPTGAAIAAAIKTDDKMPDTFAIKKVGYGAGKRTYERPSLLRAMIIEDKSTSESDCIYKLESNIDDCTGEALGYCMDKLMAAGARDVNYMPVYMKKNRPGYQLNVICGVDDVAKMEQIIFAQTTTIGIRKIKMERSILKRVLKQVDTEYGQVQVKVCDIGGMKRAYPEYDSVVDACEASGMSFQDMYRYIIGIAGKHI